MTNLVQNTDLIGGRTVTIDENYFDKLIEANDILEALRAAGVDSWEGYDKAVKSVYELPGGVIEEPVRQNAAVDSEAPTQ